MSWDIYQDVIIEHSSSPSNYRDLNAFSHKCHGKNPNCGDSYELKISLVDNKISDIGFTGEGCSISKSSLSIMTEMVKGLSTEEANSLAEYCFKFISTGEDSDGKFDDLDNMSAFGNIHNHIGRIRCATLGWQVFAQALLGKEDADIK